MMYWRSETGPWSVSCDFMMLSWHTLLPSSLKKAKRFFMEKQGQRLKKDKHNGTTHILPTYVLCSFCFKLWRPWHKLANNPVFLWVESHFKYAYHIQLPTNSNISTCICRSVKYFVSFWMVMVKFDWQFLAGQAFIWNPYLTHCNNGFWPSRLYVICIKFQTHIPQSIHISHSRPDWEQPTSSEPADLFGPTFWSITNCRPVDSMTHLTLRFWHGLDTVNAGVHSKGRLWRSWLPKLLPFSLYNAQGVCSVVLTLH